MNSSSCPRPCLGQSFGGAERWPRREPPAGRAGAQVSERLGLAPQLCHPPVSSGFPKTKEIDFLTVSEPQFLHLQMESVKAIFYASCGN